VSWPCSGDSARGDRTSWDKRGPRVVIVARRVLPSGVDTRPATWVPTFVIVMRRPGLAEAVSSMRSTTLTARSSSMILGCRFAKSEMLA